MTLPTTNHSSIILFSVPVGIVKFMHHTMIFNLSNTRFFTTLLIFAVNSIFIKSDKALLFNLERNSLVEKEVDVVGGKTKIVCQKCGIACPMVNNEETKYSYLASPGKRVLLMEKIYDGPVNINEIKLPECDEPIQTSIVFNKNSNFLETGYEIHDTKGIIDPSLLKNETNDFLSLYPTDSINEPTEPKKVFLNYYSSGKKDFLQEITEKFIWFPILLIDFNIYTMSPTRIEYNPDSGIHQPRGNCHQFDVGKEFYNENSLRSAYSHANQRLLFTGKNEVDFIPSKEKPLCGQKYGCLVQHQIIPSYYFHSYYGALATCTYMNTIPIWDSIVERVNIVDRYLYAMTQIWGSNIRIVNRFSGVFKPSRKYFKEIPFSEQNLYLDQTNINIPVPLIFYKIVDYQINIPSQDKLNHYHAIIVIHNDPTSDASKQKICKGKNAVKGWEDIQNSKPLSGLTYVCVFNKEVANRLDFLEKGIEEDESPLRLDKFFVYNAQKGKYEYVNKKYEIRRKIKELFASNKN